MDKHPSSLDKDRQTVSPWKTQDPHFTYAEPGWQGWIQLPDGTYHGFGDTIVQVSEEELNRQLSAKGIPPLPASEITKLKEAGFIKH
jgi:hypothetical protein